MTRIFVLLSAALVATCVTASAQTRYITGEITGGSFNADPATPMLRANYDITGPGFHFVAESVEPGFLLGATQCFAPGCRPGDEVSLFGNFTGSYLGVGMAVVGEETLTPAYFSGMLVFPTGTVTILRGNRKHLVLSTPFTLVGAGQYPDTLAGELTVLAGSSSSTEPPWTVATLIGSGTATAFFRRDTYKDIPGRFFYALERVVYSFNVPPPTPPKRR